MLQIHLKKNEDRRLRGGHPWVFSNEIARFDGERTPGVAAELFDAGGGLLGCGHYNPQSLIALRLFSRQRADLDSVDFYAERIAAARRLRETLYPELTTYRAVYGESDFLPGLVVDRYGDHLSIQLLSAGMDCRRHLLVDALQQVFAPQGIIARNDVAVRALEGLPEPIEVLAGTIPPLVEMEENGLTFAVDLHSGQKTGGFLDQKENHRLLQSISAGQEVLDCFCYSGSWGVHAAAYGAKSVLGLDISARAVAQAQANAQRNGVADRTVFEQCDAFERLRSLQHEGRRFGVVIMDPPAFVKSKKQLVEATRGYLTVNRRALELLAPGGTLITCSCSYHMGREAFRDVLAQAARQAKRDVRLIATCSQAPDHPVLLAFPESEYLKCLVLQAI
jgi:23S rRNA (cytosine1962-C5)-methyltransferase